MGFIIIWTCEVERQKSGLGCQWTFSVLVTCMCMMQTLILNFSRYSGFQKPCLRRIIFFFFLRGANLFWCQCEKSSSSMKDSDPPPPYHSGNQRETENVVSIAFGANLLEEAEELDLFSRFCTVQGIGIDILIGALQCIHQNSISGSQHMLLVLCQNPHHI